MGYSITVTGILAERRVCCGREVNDVMKDALPLQPGPAVSLHNRITIALPRLGEFL